jgi:4-amino-4-deoxy-L-arabinose transferase-like glycosyltransferase
VKADLFLDVFFMLAILLSALSLFCFRTGKERTSLLLLGAGSLCLGLFIARADPFLHIWDEQYHALVAKHLMEDPLKPMLIKDPLFGFSPEAWADRHIWLHKQPLFLWQIALSLKIFGLTEVGVRFPSVMMHAIMILFIYRCGRICVNKQTGYYAALLYTFAYFPLEYISGSYSTDHNDSAFLFYGFASIWALIEYQHSKNRWFLLWIGLFAGAAVLCKWLTGLLVYGLWACLILYEHRRVRPGREWLRLLLSFAICLLVFLPWQIFCTLRYPEEYRFSMDFNFRHIFEPLEGHGGDHFFYYRALYEQFGEGLLIPPLVLLAFGLTVWRLKAPAHRLIFLLTAICTYAFFSLVKTKMYGYVFVVIPFFILSLGASVTALGEWLAGKIRVPVLQRGLPLVLVLLVTGLLFDADKLYKRHSMKETARFRTIKIREKAMYLAMKDQLAGTPYLIFNCTTSLNSHILGIFYTGQPAFNYILPDYQIIQARQAGYQLIAIDDGNLPGYVLNDTGIRKISWQDPNL